MRRYLLAQLMIGMLAAMAPCGALASSKTAEGPPPIEFTILRDGKVSGTFSYKVATFSGKYFSSSQLEMKTKKGTIVILTHVEKDGAGKLLKYRKWVGNEGASPDIIAFWNNDKLRVVSKVKGKRFTKDLTPGKGFQVLDQMGFALYGDLADLWHKKKLQEFEVATIHVGRLDKASMASAGVAILKDSAGKEVQAEAVSLKSKSFNLTFFVGEKQRYLGFKSKRMVLIRKGWNLVRVEEGKAPATEEEPAAEQPAAAAPEAVTPVEVKPVEVKPVEVKPEEKKPEEKKPEEKKPEEKKPKEKLAPEKSAEEKKDTGKPLPPLPE